MSNGIHFSRGLHTEDNTPAQKYADDFGQFRDLVLSDQSATKGKQWIAAPCTAAPDDDLHRTGGSNGSFARAIGKPHRCMACVIDRRFIALDADKVESQDALDDLHAYLAFNKINSFGWETHSNRADNLRVRFIIEADRAMSRDECMRASSAMRHRINGALGGPDALDRFGFDETLDRPEQPVYLPPKVGARFQQDGHPVNVDELLASEAAPRMPSPALSAPAATLGAVVEVGRHASILKESLLLAADVTAGHMTREEAFAVLRMRRDGGRYTRHVPDDEIARALDGQLAKNGPVLTVQTEEGASDLADSVRALLTPLTEAEIEDAAKPYPHAFMRGEMGIFPMGEAAIIAAPGREGKTTAIISVAFQFGLARPLAGLDPVKGSRVVVLSAEDDRGQYARKLGALLEQCSPSESRQVRDRVLIPSMDHPAVREYKQLVAMVDRHPKATPMVDALITALAPQKGDMPVGLVIVETASTWNDAPEDNPGQRAMALVCKRIARETGAAVVLVHHTSQVASSSLPTLDLTADMARGGTSLVNNTRQTWLVVDLGSMDEPFPSNDSRTVLRECAAPGNPHRITMLVCLDSSKSELPPVVYLQWERSKRFGARVRNITAGGGLDGLNWRKVRPLIQAQRKDKRQEAKEERTESNVRQCVGAVQRLHDKGTQASTKAVSISCGNSSPTWARPYLESALEQGLITAAEEHIPRARGLHLVYRPIDSAESAQ